MTFGTELRHLKALRALRPGIGHPDIAVLVDGHLVRLDKKTSAEILQGVAVGGELDHRNAVVRFTTVRDPEVVVRIDCDGIDRHPWPRRRGPVRDQPVGVGQVIVGLRAGITRLSACYSSGGDAREQCNSKSCQARAHGSPPLVICYLGFPKAYRSDAGMDTSP